MQKNFYKINLNKIKLSVITHNNSFVQTNHIHDSSPHQESKLVHMHPLYELFIVTGGEAVVTTEKERYTCKNSVLIIPPQLPHYATFNNTTALNVNFRLVNKPNENEDIVNAINSKLSTEITELPLNNTLTFYTKQLTGKGKQSVSEEEIPLLLSLIFLQLLSPMTPSEKSSNSESETDTSYQAKYNHYITKLGAYITQNIEKNIVLEDLANELHICTKHVSRIIKSEYNCSLSQLVIRYRMNMAIMLLKNTDMKITDIALSLGYNSLANFHRHFKKACGTPPMEYRRSIKNN